MQKTARGFTLSELLVALGILGALAAFTIPKLLLVAEEQKRKSLLKDTVELVSNVMYEIYLSDDGSDFIPKLKAKSNYLDWQDANGAHWTEVTLKNGVWMEITDDGTFGNCRSARVRIDYKGFSRFVAADWKRKVDLRIYYGNNTCPLDGNVADASEPNLPMQIKPNGAWVTDAQWLSDNAKYQELWQ